MKNSNKRQCGSKVKGWILDLYPEKAGAMAVWVKTRNGDCVKLVDTWHPSFFVSAPTQKDLKNLTFHLKTAYCEYVFAEKFVNLDDNEPSQVLKIMVPDKRSLQFFARLIWQLGDYRKYRLWNVDIPYPQMYLYEKDLFPLAYVEATVTEGAVTWTLLDAAESVDYETPPLKIVRLKIEVDKEGISPCFEDPINKIRLEYDDETFPFDSGNERDKILALVESVQVKDPDIIITQGGDSFFLTYLARRALENNALSDLVLGREKTRLNLFKNRGDSYFSYGRVYYRAKPQRLLGRLHIDVENSILYAHYGMQGLIEIARTCRTPLHKASRASIGTCMMAIQLYQAVKDDYLVPWKKSEPENFKTAMDLLVADRGGFYFEPKLGIHDNVGEIDFSSMYPTLMLQKNISPETIGCKCCPESRNRVPELDYNVCEKRMGIVPKVLDLMLKKRMHYKAMRDKATEPQEHARYDQRQAAYKIILCTCFGYLGYRNARFGKVDAHIAACAYARKTLLDTSRYAEEKGFEIVHGIVDSLYLKKKDATDKDFIELCKEITEKTGLPISFEGRYRWIVFLPSKTHSKVPVLNRFYGVFNNGKVKARGIDLRRGDTPNIVSQCQTDMIQELAKAKNSKEFLQRIPEAFLVYKRYAEKVVERKVDLNDLVITKHLSKNPDEYVSNVHQAIAAKQLLEHGIEVSAGQNIKYVILDADNKHPERRVVTTQLMDTTTRYDTRKYLSLLKDSLNNILSHLIFSNKIFSS